MDQTTPGVELLFDVDKADERFNYVSGASLWSLFLLQGLLVALFGGYTLTWCLIALFNIVAAASAVLISPLTKVQSLKRLRKISFGSFPPRTYWAPLLDADCTPLPSLVVKLSNIWKSYRSVNGEETVVLKGLDLSIKAGSFNVIRGESGSGKTSLLRILGMLDGNFNGEYLFMANDVKTKPYWYRDELRANNIGFIFQDGQLFAHMSIVENVALPVHFQGTAEQRRSVKNFIALLSKDFFSSKELDEDILSHRPKLVSGGQKQRAAILRSVISKPAIILADEPTASLDEDRKKEVLKVLVSLCRAGHTVIVVSHDKVFYDTGRQLELSNGVLREIASDAASGGARLAFRAPASGESILYGWWPRAPLSILVRQAMRETFLRPIFLFLVLISLCVGVCQIGVFSSIIVGAQTFLDDAMTRGSRLNRLEVKPRTGDLDKVDRFPVINDIKSWDGIQSIVPRRAALVRVYGADGEKNIYSALGLQTDDPEYRLFNFVAGGPFNSSNEELEIIVTVTLVQDLFADAASLGNGSKHYSDFIGRPVVIEVPAFSATGQELTGRSRKIRLKIVGIILYAEGGRQLYLPNRTLLVFDRYKMDRQGLLTLPANASGDVWTDRNAVHELAAFPWEDQLQVYTKEIRDIIPIFRQLSELGYKPSSDIWNFKWVLDVRDLAWKIFIPLLLLIILAVGLTVATNLFSSAKLRETEFALWRILGMRRGDLVITQVISTILMVLVGAAIGLLIGNALVDGARTFLVNSSPGSGLEKVFAPVSQFFIAILAGSIVVGMVAAIYPAIRTAHADPAKVLQS
jgi:ABC-type lipoprotein export system ATPase subunit